MMNDPVDDFLETLLGILDYQGNFNTKDFNSLLDAYELMIAPISDPSNLFGILEDSL